MPRPIGSDLSWPFGSQAPVPQNRLFFLGFAGNGAETDKTRSSRDFGSTRTTGAGSKYDESS